MKTTSSLTLADDHPTGHGSLAVYLFVGSYQVVVERSNFHRCPRDLNISPVDLSSLRCHRRNLDIVMKSADKDGVVGCGGWTFIELRHSTSFTTSLSIDTLTLINLDVKNLYTVILHNGGLNALKYYLDLRPVPQPHTSTHFCLTVHVLSLNCFSFALDILVTIHHFTLTTTIHYQNTATYSYLCYRSSHPNHINHSITYSKFPRLCKLCSDAAPTSQTTCLRC